MAQWFNRKSDKIHHVIIVTAMDTKKIIKRWIQDKNTESKSLFQVESHRTRLFPETSFGNTYEMCKKIPKRLSAWGFC